MAKIKSLKLKNKEFIFKSFGNDGDINPAKIIFNRFPRPTELFAPIDKKYTFEGIDITKIQEIEVQNLIIERIVNSFVENTAKGSVDYKAFFEECVDGFKDLEYEKSKIVTASDFFQILPPDAAYTIAKEAYEYASERDEFTVGE